MKARGQTTVEQPTVGGGRLVFEEGHVDGQEAPDRVHRTGSFVRWFVRCVRRMPSEGVTALFGFEAINRGELGLS